MKKNRPAYKLNILCLEHDLDKFTELLLKETSTFGVRYHKLERELLDRKFVKITTKYGDVQVKLGYLNGKIIKATPEHEDCKLIAKKENISLNSLYIEINSIINEKFLQNH